MSVVTIITKGTEEAPIYVGIIGNSALPKEVEEVIDKAKASSFRIIFIDNLEQAFDIAGWELTHITITKWTKLGDEYIPSQVHRRYKLQRN